MLGLKASIVPEALKYSVVGGAGTLVDIALFNLCLWLTSISLGSTAPVMAKIASTIGSALFAYIGHGFWTFRSRGGPRSEAATIGRFALITVIALVVGASIVGVAHYVFDFRDTLSNNVANVIALLVAAAFRFLTTRSWVFSGPRLRDTGSPR